MLAIAALLASSLCKYRSFRAVALAVSIFYLNSRSWVNGPMTPSAESP